MDRTEGIVAEVKGAIRPRIGRFLAGLSRLHGEELCGVVVARESPSLTGVPFTIPHMADLAYCTAADVTALAGQMAIDLRLDDLTGGEATAFLASAIDYASGRIDYYCSRYAQAELAANRWVKGVAVLVALRKLASRRLNRPSKAIEHEWEERQAELELIRQGKAQVPTAASTRRPVVVTNYKVDLRLPNNQVRVDKARSTGVAKDYRRPTDNAAPDAR